MYRCTPKTEINHCFYNTSMYNNTRISNLYIFISIPLNQTILLNNLFSIWKRKSIRIQENLVSISAIILQLTLRLTVLSCNLLERLGGENRKGSMRGSFLIHPYLPWLSQSIRTFLTKEIVAEIQISCRNMPIPQPNAYFNKTIRYINKYEEEDI